VTKFLTATVSALALASLAAPASAQHQHMPGMQMPAPAKPASKKKPAAKMATKPVRPTAKSPQRQEAAEPEGTTPAEAAQDQHGAGTQIAPPAEAPVHLEDQSAMAAGMPEMAMGTHGHSMPVSSALGTYPMQRESSGTAWQPDTSEHMGLMNETGDWMLMAHGVVNLVADHQSGSRGDDKIFPSGMLMGMARRPLGNGTLQLRASLSPDPLMGKRGYPLLLASGETANGRDRLIDRQHPHDFFMELSASVSQNIAAKSSVFIYAGLPGEPAFGPPAFMHREAIMDSPEAPISHHWLDSTHISFGVVTGGIVLDRVKVEVSRFNGREPDQHRWNLETGALDSTAVRLSWNPTPELSLQGSWGHFVDPEQLEPGVNQKRWSASLLYAREMAGRWNLAGTLAWGRKTIDGHGKTLSDDAFVAEASLKNGPWTVFSRGEITENRELLRDFEHGPAYRVGKLSVGVVRDFRIAKHLSLGAGGLFSLNFVPDGLAALYGGHNPTGAMAFVRLKLD